MSKSQDVEIAVIGAGIAGIATAYYLCTKYHCNSVLLVDARDPMSYTTAQSGDNYRNWWPNQVMTQFTDDSIRLMADIAQQSSNVLGMQQRGYLLATRRTEIDELLTSLEENYSDSAGRIRVHDSPVGSAYQQTLKHDWKSTLGGVDVVANKALINQTFPVFSSDIENVLHIRRAGVFSGQQLGEYMLQRIKPLGSKRLRGQVTSISLDRGYQLEVQGRDGPVCVQADLIVNAAGPYIAEIANMLNIALPVTNVFQQKLAFEDHLNAVPRDLPFAIDIDQAVLDWADEEALALKQDSDLSWLTRPITGGIHCRPDGAGSWIKLGWAYNREVSIPDNTKQLTEDPQFDTNFPEIVLRGAKRLNPRLAPYIEALPARRIHYGGYYTMTKENWPLIGPLDDTGAYITGALSGFGSMAACAAGALCADWVCGGERPAYAEALSLARYKSPELMAQLQRATDIGLL